MGDLYESRLQAFVEYANASHLGGLSYDAMRHVFRTNSGGGVHASATLCAFLSGWYETRRYNSDNDNRQDEEDSTIFPYVCANPHTVADVGVQRLLVDGRNGDAYFQSVAVVAVNHRRNAHAGGALVHDVKRFAHPPPLPAYELILRNRIADHIQRKQTTDIVRRTSQGITFSPSLCAAIRGKYDAHHQEKNACDSRLFPIFVTGRGIGVAYLNMDISGPTLTHLPMTFVNKHD
jgi:hypothetical protein